MHRARREADGVLRIVHAGRVSYELGLRDDGWLVVDVSARRVAEFGGLSLQGLSNDEAETMRGLLLHHDRACAALIGPAVARVEMAVEPHAPASAMPGAMRATPAELSR